jgi:branched-chain amino acid transport system permease protein
MVLEQIIVDWMQLAILALAVGFLLHELGMLSLGHSGLVLAGAYCTGLIALERTAVSTALGAVILLLLLMALTALRVRGDIFAVLTLALSEVTRLLTIGASNVTSGTLGMGPIPRTHWVASSAGAQIIAVIVLSLLAALAIVELRRWPGVVLGSIRDGELFIQGCGVRTRTVRMGAVIGSGLAAILVGVLQAQYYGLASPQMGTIDVSLQALAAAMLAWPLWRQGAPSRAIVGFIVGSLLLVLIPPTLRLIVSGGVGIAEIRQGMFGLILFILVHPRLRLARRLESK